MRESRATIRRMLPTVAFILCLAFSAGSAHAQLGYRGMGVHVNDFTICSFFS